MNEEQYLELIDFCTRWNQRDAVDKTPFGKTVYDESIKRIEEYKKSMYNKQAYAKK